MRERGLHKVVREGYFVRRQASRHGIEREDGVLYASCLVTLLTFLQDLRGTWPSGCHWGGEGGDCLHVAIICSYVTGQGGNRRPFMSKYMCRDP